MTKTSPGRIVSRLIVFVCMCIVMVSSAVTNRENHDLRATIEHLNAETANRAATSELQSRVIAAYTAELMRAGYSEGRLDAIQRSK